MRNDFKPSPAHRLGETILANRAAKAAIHCPECGGDTRDGLKDGQLWRICSTRSCTWTGSHLAQAEAAARAANVACGVGRAK